MAGDLNDEFSDPSLAMVLKIQAGDGMYSDTILYDTRMKVPEDALLFSEGEVSESPQLLYQAEVPGTIKYRGRWYTFDHIFVSGAFMTDSNLFVIPGGKCIHSPDFLTILRLKVLMSDTTQSVMVQTFLPRANITR